MSEYLFCRRDCENVPVQNHIMLIIPNVVWISIILTTSISQVRDGIFFAHYHISLFGNLYIIESEA
jgi:hypothetical protein